MTTEIEWTEVEPARHEATIDGVAWAVVRDRRGRYAYTSDERLPGGESAAGGDFESLDEAKRFVEAHTSHRR